MTVDHRQQYLENVRGGLSLLIYPLQLLVDLPNSASDWFRESLSTRRQLQEINASLRTQQLVLNVQLQKMEALEAENLRLRALLDSSFEVGERPLLIANLLSVDMDPYRHEIQINKGSLDQVYEGQPLLDSTGMMGQLIHVSPFTSTAMLITDPSHAIPVQVNRNGLRTIALGTGSLNHLKLPNIPNNADIRIGDLLVTSGLGSRFPPGYPVAEITEVDQDPSRAFSQVTARPRAQLDRSREVLLVWPPEIGEPLTSVPTVTTDDSQSPPATESPAAAAAAAADTNDTSP